jgi:cytochrome P450
MTALSAIDWRPDDPATLADPYPLFARLRDEDPCHWSPRLKSWVLTRYGDVKAVCLDAQMSSDRLRPFFASLPAPEGGRIATLMRYLNLWMVFNDPPEHTRLRRLTGRVFNAKSMTALRPVVERLASSLLDEIDPREPFDFIARFAGPLPCLVIMAMLGVPEEELPRMKRLSDAMALFIGSARMAGDKYDAAEAAMREMAGFFRELIDERRARPRADLLSELVQLRDGDDVLSGDGLVATCILLLFAGHETTTNHIANGLFALMRFPAELERLRAEPALAAQAVEELLRYEGPSGAQVRICTREQVLHGKTLRPGERLFVLLNAANRDPRAWSEPDHVQIGRDGPPHLTFGFGAHICLGFPLARLEGQVALPAVLARWPRLRPGWVAGHEPAWINSMVFRGMQSLPVLAS